MSVHPLLLRGLLKNKRPGVGVRFIDDLILLEFLKVWGRIEVESLMRKGNAVKEEVGEGLRILRLWFFAHDGFNEDKEANYETHNVG